MKITIDTKDLIHGEDIRREDEGKQFTVVWAPRSPGLTYGQRVTFVYSSTTFHELRDSNGTMYSRLKTILQPVQPVLVDATTVVKSTEAPDGDYIALTGENIPAGAGVRINPEDVECEGILYSKQAYFYVAKEAK